MKKVVILLVVAGIAVVILQQTSNSKKQPNFNVNEHVFLRVVRGNTEAAAREALGNPDRHGEGEVVSFHIPGQTESGFRIEEQCSKSPPDYFLVYAGATESIRLLYSGLNRNLVAAEYLVNDIPVFYTGPKTENCRALAAVSGTVARNSDPDDPDFLRRKNILHDFFKDETEKSPLGLEQPAVATVVAPPTTSPPPAPAPSSSSSLPTLSSLASLLPSLPKPSADEKDYRMWASASKEFSVSAKFVGLKEDQVKLLKRDGSTVVLPLKSLSSEDQQWVAKELETAFQ